MHGDFRQNFEACRARTDPFPEQTLDPSIPHVILLRDLPKPAVHSAALGGPASMERYMRVSRSRRICLSCGRSLPRAATRCPWCIASVVVPAGLADHPPPRRSPAARVASGDAMNPVLNLPFQRPAAASIASVRTAAHQPGRDSHAGFCVPGRPSILVAPLPSMNHTVLAAHSDAESARWVQDHKDNQNGLRNEET